MPPHVFPSRGLRTPQSLLQQNGYYFDDKIVVEPDMDPRKSIQRALPRRPTTTKTFMRNLRFSALLTFTAGLVVFVLGLLVILAGKRPGQLEGQFVLKLNTSRVGEDIIRFERASATTSATPTATTTQATNPLGPFGIFPTTSPLNPQNPNNPLNGILNTLTDSINNGLGDAVNTLIEGLVDQTGVQDFYYIYLNNVCQASIANGTEANDDGVTITKCQSSHDAFEGTSPSLTLPRPRLPPRHNLTHQNPGLKRSFSQIQSPVTIGNIGISIPPIASLANGTNTIFSTLNVVHRAIFAFLITTIITAGIVSLLSLPATFFPASRLLIYTNLFLSLLASFFPLLAAILLSILFIVVPRTVGALTQSFGIVISMGGTVLAFLWVVWALCTVVLGFWAAAWFVEARRWAFVRSRRGQMEVGNWRGIFGEVGRNLRGTKDG
ncbi:hypothetical protein CC80DRAFT_583175 [Byssothecium circinans]|uniref:Actin cortical patch SUR7/pH-response regulator PalI n=1 Tax=Byssothecium circinans TaxID=147558 RepID=A0A6A5U903_9PLEO|nr:hypothetical protein CC80DRAFT_583175 [Byssothecium circinans]